MARNLYVYIQNLNLERNVYIYGLGDLVKPYSNRQMKRTKSNWDPREGTTEDIIRELNRTSKQRMNNNRISITFLK